MWYPFYSRRTKKKLISCCIFVIQYNKKSNLFFSRPSQIDCFQNLNGMAKLDGLFQIANNRIKCNGFDLLIMSRKQTTSTKADKFLLIYDHDSKVKTYCSSMYPLNTNSTYKIDYKQTTYMMKIENDQVTITNHKAKSFEYQ
jgi:hypothetical protein